MGRCVQCFAGNSPGGLTDECLEIWAKQVPLDSVSRMLQHVGGQGSAYPKDIEQCRARQTACGVRQHDGCQGPV